MSALLAVGICSLFACLFLTPFFRDFFGFLEMVDRPDARRKLHKRPIPRVGGIPLGISYICTLAATLLVASFWKQLLAESGPSIHLLVRLLPALLIIVLTGLIDDLKGLTPWQKISGQILAAVWTYFAGVHLTPIDGHSPLWTAALSVLWLVFCANAFNLIDGLDGLASGVGLLAATGLLLAALIHHHPVLALATVPLVGGLIGFLYYNFNPASVFLGDSGSLLVGFLIGCLGLMWNQHAATGFGRFAPVMALAVPAAEVGISIFRRFLRSAPIFDADRNHIHHRLLSLGMTQKKATLILYAVSALAATLAVLQTIVRPEAATVLMVLFVAGAYVGIRRLHYIEFGALRNLFLNGELRHLLRMQICLKEYEESLEAAHSVEECWGAVRQASAAAGFRHVALQVGGMHFEFEEETKRGADALRMMIPLTNAGQILFVQDRPASALAMWIAPIAEGLEAKLKELLPAKPRDRVKTLTAVAQ